MRRSLLAEESAAVRDVAAEHSAAMMAAAAAAAAEDDREDVTVPLTSANDSFTTAGARAGKRSSVRGLDVLASVNPDGALCK